MLYRPCRRRGWCQCWAAEEGIPCWSWRGYYRYIFRLSLVRVMITSFVHVLRAGRRSAVWMIYINEIYYNSPFPSYRTYIDCFSDYLTNIFCMAYSSNCLHNFMTVTSFLFLFLLQIQRGWLKSIFYTILTLPRPQPSATTIS